MKYGHGWTHAGPLHPPGRDESAPGRIEGGRVGQAFAAQPYQASPARCQLFSTTTLCTLSAAADCRLCCLLPLPYMLHMSVTCDPLTGSLIFN